MHESNPNALPVIKNLGWMNNWSSDSENWTIIQKCQDAGHLNPGQGTDGATIGRCTYSHWCSVCGYEYSVDSSD